MNRWALLFLFLAVTARAENGTSSAQFLRLPADARSAALGQGGIALVDDASALAWNPAALIKLRGASVAATHAAYLDESAFNHVAAGMPYKKGAVALGVRHFSTARLPYLDSAGNSLGDVRPQDLAISLGGAWPTRFGAVGGSLKSVRSRLANSASAYTVDLGYLSPPLFWQSMGLAAAYTNAIGSLRYDQESDPLPRTFRLGGRAMLTGAWDLALDAAYPQDSDPFFSLGTEFRLKQAAALRAGYNSRAGAADMFSGISFGLGLGRAKWALDYAFLPVGTAGTTHWFTLSYRTGPI